MSPFDAAYFLSLIRGKGARYGQPLNAMGETDSTNDDALLAARRGAEGGSTFVCDVQRRGRGRRGRTWSSNAGQSLTASVLLRPLLPAESVPLVTLAAGLALRDALLRSARVAEPAQIGVKWPNDVLHDGKKLAGILTESVSQGARVDAVVVGFGVNLGDDGFPPELAHRATSVRRATSVDVPREELLAETLFSLGSWMERLEAGDVASLRDALVACDALRDERILLDDAPAVARGIDERGALLVERDGKRSAVTSGTVELARWHE